MWELERRVVADDTPLDRLISECGTTTARILEKALAREEVSADEGTHLLGTTGAELTALIRCADEIRRQDVGDEVTYVINRNLNWTNVCFVGCKFCAFARHRKDEDAYYHSTEDLLRKVEEAIALGAHEVCMQAGINPEQDGFVYRDLVLAIKKRFPQIHIHAFSPMEIMYGARRAEMNYRDFLTMLRDAGLGTIPGTAAEILDDEIREILSHKKVDVATWIEIVTTAHSIGLRSSATVMYGHIETPGHVARHIDLIRSLQKQTGGFTEFVPLRFIHNETALYHEGLVGEPPPKGLVDLRVYACSRLMLRGWIDNLQTSWVKLGHELSQVTLMAGCNDFGGTLMEESITREAGGDAGEYLPVETIRALITDAGRIPVERTTVYEKRICDGSEQDFHGARGRGGSSPFPARAEQLS